MDADWEIVHNYAHSFNSVMLQNDKAKLIFTDPPFGTGKLQQLGNSKYMDQEEHDMVINGLKSATLRHLDTKEH